MKPNWFSSNVRALQKTFQQVRADSGLPVLRQQSDINQNKLALTFINEHSTRRTIVQKNNAGFGLWEAFVVLKPLRIVLHCDERLLLLLFQKLEFIQASGRKDFEQERLVIGRNLSQAYRSIGFRVNLFVAQFDRILLLDHFLCFVANV